MVDLAKPSLFCLGIRVFFKKKIKYPLTERLELIICPLLHGLFGICSAIQNSWPWPGVKEYFKFALCALKMKFRIAGRSLQFLYGYSLKRQRLCSSKYMN